MTPRIHYTICPACSSSEIRRMLEVKDHSVSQELFEIWECNNCTIRFTQNIPGPEEIGRYYHSEDYISHSDTGKGLVNRLYHTVRKRTLQKKKKLVLQYSGIKKGTLLDLGAGTGSFAGVMQSSGWKVTGLEPDTAARGIARRQHKLELKDPSHLFAIEDRSVDVITLWHVLEHVHTLHSYIKQFKKIVRPGGIIFIAVPNYTSVDAIKYGSFWAAYDVPRHLYHFSPESMAVLLKQHELLLVSTLPMWFDSYYVSLLSEKYKTGRQGLAKGFLNGLLSNAKALNNTNRCSSMIYVVAMP